MRVRDAGIKWSASKAGTIVPKDNALYDRSTRQRAVPTFTLTVGPLVYVVVHDLLRCAPFGLFLVYLDKHYVGAQLTHPEVSNLAFLHRLSREREQAAIRRAQLRRPSRADGIGALLAMGEY